MSYVDHTGSFAILKPCAIYRGGRDDLIELVYLFIASTWPIVKVKFKFGLIKGRAELLMADSKYVIKMAAQLAPRSHQQQTRND